VADAFIKRLKIHSNIIVQTADLVWMASGNVQMNLLYNSTGKQH